MSLIIGSGIAACLIYASYKTDLKFHDKETKIILKVFENIDYQKKGMTPRLFKKSAKDNYTDYIFNVPYGLIDKKELEPTLEKTLGKNVRVSFKQKLFVRIYNKRLPVKFNYNWEATKGWTVPIGRTLDGTIYHDFDKIPHMGISGTTRYGKTVLLKLIFAHLINNHEAVEFFIIDLKRLEFGRYRNLKQVKQVARDPAEAKECLTRVVNKMDKDMKDFERKGYNNIVNTNVKRRTFIVVDEGGQLDKSLHPHLEKIAQMGGAVGYRLIFATQYSTGDVFPRQVKQNSDAKIAFRLPTETASRVAIDEMGAEQIDNVGTAIYRTVERHLIQVPYIDDKDIQEKLRRFEVENRTEGPEAGTDTIDFG